MCCHTSNELESKFHESTYDEFTGGVFEFSELSKWERNELKNYVLTTHYDDAPEYRLKRKLCYQMASPFNYNGNQWTRIAQSKMNSSLI